MSHASLVALGCTIGAQIINRPSKSTVSVFEKLPREIRDMIYELCLCVDGIIVPYPEWNATNYMPRVKGRKPEVALLALNKWIRDEALPILFGKNTWRITAKIVNLAGDHASRLRNGYLDTLWDRYGSRIQKVDLKYTRAQHSLNSFEMNLYLAHESSPSGTLEDRNERADIIHDYVTKDLKFAWVIITRVLAFCPNIKSVHIDVGDLYCPIGCCRTNIVQKLFTKPGYMAEVRAGVAVSVSGIFDKEERGYVVAWRKAIAHTQIITYRPEQRNSGLF